MWWLCAYLLAWPCHTWQLCPMEKTSSLLAMGFATYSWAVVLQARKFGTRRRAQARGPSPIKQQIYQNGHDKLSCWQGGGKEASEGRDWATYDRSWQSDAQRSQSHQNIGHERPCTFDDLICQRQPRRCYCYPKFIMRVLISQAALSGTFLVIRSSEQLMQWSVSCSLMTHANKFSLDRRIYTSLTLFWGIQAGHELPKPWQDYGMIIAQQLQLTSSSISAFAASHIACQPW